MPQDSDVVILLHHNLIDDMPTGEVDVIVGKNRTGKLATVTLPWKAYRARIG
jgi:replicative DNA helicase